jgi:tetratricopeptide (TPR) repeat protein
MDDTNPVFQSDPVLKAMTEQIQNNPKNVALWVDRGNTLRKMKLDSLAVKDYKHAIALDSNNASLYSLVGDVLFENKDIQGSVQWLQKALTKDPNDKKARLKVAKMFLYIGKHSEGFQQIDIVLRNDAYNPEAYYLKGMLYKDMKDTAKALSSFQTAVQVSPDYKDAIVQLGVIYASRKDSIALRYLDNAFKVDSSDVFPIFARGVYYQEQKDFARAKEEYTRCILHNRHYVDAYFNMGNILMQQDSVQKSMRQFAMVLKVDPRNPTAYYDRGVCYEVMDSMKSAIDDYRHALILDPTYKSPKEALKRLKVGETEKGKP